MNNVRLSEFEAELDRILFDNQGLNGKVYMVGDNVIIKTSNRDHNHEETSRHYHHKIDENISDSHRIYQRYHIDVIKSYLNVKIDKINQGLSQFERDIDQLRDRIDNCEKKRKLDSDDS